MDRDDILLAALSAGGENATYTPVQVQKLLFLVDREAAHLIGGPFFHFSPYDYGPFDRSVYDGLDDLAQRQLVTIQNTGRYRVYSLTPAGREEGARLLGSMPPKSVVYLKSVAAWIKKLNFAQLVAAIYNRYPDMKVNSVFRG